MSATTRAPGIGVFDSGFGGLTVLRALLARMPVAHYEFLGDTARLPYGSKSRRTIARYAAESAQFLVREQQAEYLVIACNTASALALDAIQEAVPVPVLGVIEPGAEAAKNASRTGDVLVLATDATVRSHAYAAACQARGLRALEKACPLLVPLVEEGWTQSLEPSASQKSPIPTKPGAPGLDSETWETSKQVDVTRAVIRIYLEELLTEAHAHNMQPDTLVLGCTHYPLLRPLIEAAVPAGMRVIDSAESTAEVAAQHFNLAAAPAPAAPHAEIHCFATDSVEKFERLGSRFLGRPTGKVELVDLGG